ncbi:LolA-like putative outer membrane lipoprotein chaperone [Mucilaginibacter koreensis]
MKKIFTFIILFTIVGYSAAFAQQDAQAKSILSQVGKKYKSYGTVKTDFVMTMSSPQNESRGSQSGTLVSQSGTGKFKVTLYSPVSKRAVEQEIISDGKTQWTYLKRDNEVQVNNIDNGASGLNPASLFTMYEKGYKYLYTGLQKSAGKTYQAIELSPTSASQTIFKVKLLIDPATKLIHSAQLFDKNGTHYTYTLSNFIPNPKLAGTYFTFDAKAHPGVNVEDLR